MRHDTFAEQLLALRKARGLTQRRVAEICGVSTVTVWNWEKGRATPWSADKVLAQLMPPAPHVAEPSDYGKSGWSVLQERAAARRLIDNIGE